MADKRAKLSVDFVTTGFDKVGKQLKDLTSEVKKLETSFSKVAQSLGQISQLAGSFNAVKTQASQAAQAVNQVATATEKVGRARNARGQFVKAVPPAVLPGFLPTASPLGGATRNVQGRFVKRAAQAANQAVAPAVSTPHGSGRHDTFVDAVPSGRLGTQVTRGMRALPRRARPAHDTLVDVPSGLANWGHDTLVDAPSGLLTWGHDTLVDDVPAALFGTQVTQRMRALKRRKALRDTLVDAVPLGRVGTQVTRAMRTLRRRVVHDTDIDLIPPGLAAWGHDTVVDAVPAGRLGTSATRPMRVMRRRAAQTAATRSMRVVRAVHDTLVDVPSGLATWGHDTLVDSPSGLSSWGNDTAVDAVPAGRLGTQVTQAMRRTRRPPRPPRPVHDTEVDLLPPVFPPDDAGGGSGGGWNGLRTARSRWGLTRWAAGVIASPLIAGVHAGRSDHERNMNLRELAMQKAALANGLLNNQGVRDYFRFNAMSVAANVGMTPETAFGIMHSSLAGDPVRESQAMRSAVLGARAFGYTPDQMRAIRGAQLGGGALGLHHGRRFGDALVEIRDRSAALGLQGPQWERYANFAVGEYNRFLDTGSRFDIRGSDAVGRSLAGAGLTATAAAGYMAQFRERTLGIANAGPASAEDMLLLQTLGGLDLSNGGASLGDLQLAKLRLRGNEFTDQEFGNLLSTIRQRSGGLSANAGGYLVQQLFPGLPEDVAANMFSGAMPLKAAKAAAQGALRQYATDATDAVSARSAAIDVAGMRAVDPMADTYQKLDEISLRLKEFAASQQGSVDLFASSVEKFVKSLPGVVNFVGGIVTW